MTITPIKYADPNDLAMLEFATRWAPYGGGSAGDIYVEFGLSADEYFTRVIELVERERRTYLLDNKSVQILRNLCAARLAHLTAPAQSDSKYCTPTPHPRTTRK